MRIRETGSLSEAYILKAIEAHAKRVGEEFRSGVAHEHRLAHTVRMSRLARAAADRVAVADNRRAKLYEARVS